MDSVHIVKSYSYEDKSVDKYREKSKLWEYTWINYKYMAYLFDYMHSTLGDTFRILSTMCFIYYAREK